MQHVWPPRDHCHSERVTVSFAFLRSPSCWFSSPNERNVRPRASMGSLQSSWVFHSVPHVFPPRTASGSERSTLAAHCDRTSARSLSWSATGPKTERDHNTLAPMDWFVWENLQEPLDFPHEIGASQFTNPLGTAQNWPAFAGSQRWGRGFGPSGSSPWETWSKWYEESDAPGHQEMRSGAFRRLGMSWAWEQDNIV